MLPITKLWPRSLSDRGRCDPETGGTGKDCPARQPALTYGQIQIVFSSFHTVKNTYQLALFRPPAFRGTNSLRLAQNDLSGS